MRPLVSRKATRFSPSTWTLTGSTAAQVPIDVTFDTVGLPHKISKTVPIQIRPADRVFMREAESSLNQIGSAGITSCGPCSGAQKVRNLGGSDDAHVVFPDVTVPTEGDYTLHLDYTVNGTKSYFVSVNNGSPTEVSVTDVGNTTVRTTQLPIHLAAGANTIRIYNTNDSAPDLDRISIG